jgi:CBS domain-containing protein
MNAQDIMTTGVATVTPETLVSKIAALLNERRISAVPVISGERLVGIVSEADLLRRYEIGTDCAMRGEPWWMKFFGTARLPGEYVKSHARYARDIMTEDVITVAPDTALADVAALFGKHGIKRVPVLREGRLVGILSRSDLVRALAVAAVNGRKVHTVPDHTIQRLLMEELRRQNWWRSEYSNVSVSEGVVTYGGFVDVENERTAARVAAETIPGVVKVVDQRLPYQNLVSMM